MRRLLIVILILLIISPVAAVLLAKSSLSFKENRLLAKAPDITFWNLIDPAFYLKVERYFNDHFLFRSLLIKTKCLIDYHIFNTSPVSDVFIGSDGWLYYSPELIDYKKEGCKEKQKMELLAQKLHDLEIILEKSGKQFLFIVAPNKSTIYPEIVGLEQFGYGCHKSKYDLFLEALNTNPVKNFIRLDTLLIQAKKEQRYYFITDSHWNIYGATLVSKELLHKVAPSTWHNYFPEIKITTCLRNGDLAEMMAINLSTEETCENISYKSQVKVIDKKPLPNGWPRFQVNAESSKEPLLPRAIFYRDSFMYLPIEVLKGSFRQIDIYWTYDLLTPEAIEDLKNAEIVLLEVVERNLDNVDVNIHGVEVALRP